MSVNFKFPYNGQTVDVEDYYVRIDPFTQGTLWTCGLNNNGQLGDNTTVDKSSPVQTVAFGSTWKQIYHGNTHSIGLKTDGTMWTWGANANGQLGDNTTVSKSSPVQAVTFGSNWVTAAAGLNFSAAIKNDGTLWLWGANTSGQLGDNTTVNKSSPVQAVTTGTNWLTVSCGYADTFAIKTLGTLWGWGLNGQGQLGDNTIVNKSSPVQTISLTSNWVQVSCSGVDTNNNSTIALKSNSTLWAWGSNASGQIGDNTTVSKSSPVQTVTFATNWKSCSINAQASVGIKTDGTLWTWGSNAKGQLGDNTAVNKSSPIQTVSNVKTWIKVSMGYSAATAVKSDGTLWTWGNNSNGQLADNTTVNKSSPVQTTLFGSNWKTMGLSGGADKKTGFIYRVDPFI